MKERISEFVRGKAYKPMTLTELAVALSIPEKQHQQLQKMLQQMESTGEVIRTRLERYGAPERMNLAVGRLQGHPKGFGFLVPDAKEANDIFIGREAMGGAWHGDRVVARLHPATRAGGRQEGEIIRILQRANSRLVGTFETARHAGYVTPDERRIGDDIFIPKGATNGAKSGEKVVVQIIEYPVARRSAEGRIVERLGMKGEVGVDIVSVIRKHGLPEAFLPRVLKEAEEIPAEVLPESITEEKRRDLRQWTVCTIDGEDAKDLDDAISLEPIGRGLWRLGVHIADVAYYVKEGSVLDQEAYKRGTSVYLADRVVPMLPPHLSNGICSLHPRVDRLTLSCVMEINAEGRVLQYEIFPSVIKTVARMTYNQVNKILDGDPEAMSAHESLVPLFRQMQELMNILREKRNRRGALDFDLPEAKVRLNEKGWPIEIKRVDRGQSERIIEEFMLIANETVAEHCSRLELPFIYRIHGEPASDRLALMGEFLSLFGYSLRLPREGAVRPKLLQAITDWSKGRTEENLVNSVLLRAMRQAVYSDANHGHFGLAAEYYCHFTSPIRRYPDLIVHRVLRAILTGGVSAKMRSKYQRWLPDAAQYLSDRERVAVEAERETMDIKKAEYMFDKIGQAFEGIISGVSQFGFFVQLFNTAEGLVHVSSLTDDYYHFHEKLYALVGERTRRRFRLGDIITVRVERVDVENRQIEFAVEASQAIKETAAASPPPSSSSPSPSSSSSSSSSSNDGRKRKRRKVRKPGGNEAVAQEVPAAPEPTSVPPTTRPAATPKVAPASPKVAPASPKTASAASTETNSPVRAARQPAPARGQSAKSAPRRSNQVDMWGIPLPEGRTPRLRAEEDPGVVNPFSIAPTAGDRSRFDAEGAPREAEAGGTQGARSGAQSTRDERSKGVRKRTHRRQNPE